MLRRHFSGLVLVFILVGISACSDLSSPEKEGTDQEITQIQASSQISEEDENVSSTHIIVLNENISQQQTLAIADSLETSLGITVGRIYSQVLTGFSARVPEEALQALSQNASVKYVELDHPTKAGYSQSGVDWGLDRIDQRALPLDNTFIYHHKAPYIYTYVIDSGIRATHSEFGSRASGVWSYNGDTSDCLGHGTAVAAIAAGSTYGVAKRSQVRALRVWDCSGDGKTSYVIDALEWIKQYHQSPAVVNHSGCALDATVNKCTGNQALDDAVNSVLDSEIPVVISAGNGNQDACNGSPGRVPRVLTVGATNSDDSRRFSSNWGSCVDIFAPGTGITSAGIDDDNDTYTSSGTSFAAPFVTGVVSQFYDAKRGRGVYRAYADTMIKLNATDGVLNDLNGSPNRLLYEQFLDVTIDGPDSYSEMGTLTFEAMPTGGDGNYSYRWKVYWEYSGEWDTLGTNKTQSVTPPVATDFKIQVKVWSEDVYDTNSKWVYDQTGAPDPQ